MIAWLQDLRYSLRALAKRRLHAVMTIVVFALAIGANATVFSIYDGLFLRPLPYPDDARLVMVHSAPRAGAMPRTANNEGDARASESCSGRPSPSSVRDSRRARRLPATTASSC
ncbi:MAG TPA: hypothetical protein VFV10_16615 [Gammaproteobacteria bacterium]|nr:hypothetical protein [Gammaproteobacteria bacterium]